MATAEQIKSLIHSHLNDEIERFYTIALQVAAHEAKQGHTALAMEIRQLIDNNRSKKINNIENITADLRGLILKEERWKLKSSLVISENLLNYINRVIHEYRQQNKLKMHGLENRRKILLVGPPGTGKTMTASVIAKELHLYLYTIQMDKIVTKFMGESSAKLRQIFDMINIEEGVYLFDEFDAIGGDRDNNNDVGEMRRILNSFLHFMDYDKSNSIIIAVTNNDKILDQALFRRFDDVLYYTNPNHTEREKLIKNILGDFLPKKFPINDIVDICEGLSHAEIDNACRDSIKYAILSDNDEIDSSELIKNLNQRKSIYQRIKG